MVQEVESGNVLERAFEKAGLGVAHISTNRRFLRVSPRLCEILGYPEQELLRLTGKDISHADDADVINRQRTRLYAGEIDAVRVEKRYLRKDGSVVWVSFTMVLERAADGTPLYEIAVYDDITGRKRTEGALKESEALFRSTFELAASGVAHVSLDGRFLRVNRQLCGILRYREDELIGRSVKEVSHPEDRDVTDAQRARVHAGERESVRFEKRYLRKDGSTVWVSLGVALVRGDGGAPLYEIAMFDDITERKQAEAALREAHEELKRSNSELEQFAYVASHDLSEPLRMVTSYLQLLQRRYEGRLDEDADEFIRFAVDGATRMRSLIDALLLYSRAGRGDTPVEPVDTAALVDRVADTLTAGREGPVARIHHDGLPAIAGDPAQLGQLFQNLLGNALKFTSPEREPEIEVSAEPSGPGWVFTVADNGIGFDEAHAERIFRMFQRLHGRDEYPGTGVGLAIARKVVERHGGRIWAEPRPDGGARFRFELPGATA